MHKLAVLSGGSKGTVFVLAEDSHSIGRADENMIVLDDGNVSRHHAVLTLNGADYKLKDLNSANGTFVNGERITEVLLKNGDRLRLGVTEMLYESVAAKGDRPLTISPPRPQLVPSRPVGTISPSVTLAPAAPAAPAVAPVPAPRPVSAPRPILAPSVVPVEKTAKHPKLWLVAGVTAVACWVAGGLLLWWLGIFPRRQPATANSGPTPAATAPGAKPAVAIVVTSIPRNLPATEPETKDKASVARNYSDPQGRFVCTVPGGWQIEEDRSASPPKVRFVSGADEIRVVVQPSDQSALAETDRESALKEFGGVLERAQTAGATGQLLGVTWRQIPGCQALQSEFVITAPNYLWMRQVKFITNGLDHTLALYVGAADQRERVAPVFEKLLESYHSPAPKSPSS